MHKKQYFDVTIFLHLNNVDINKVNVKMPDLAIQNTDI